MKSNFQPYCHIPRERVEANVVHCKALALPGVHSALRPRLAVIGGGHSVKDHLDELRGWQGDIWACGSAVMWCRAHGIDALFFCIDPAALVAGYTEGVKRAILATCCDPSVFAALKDASVRVFELFATETMANHGCTTMTAAPELSIKMGYRDVTFFGGDSCFPDTGDTHVTHCDPAEIKMVVKAAGESFYTCAEFLMQAELMATIIRIAPQIFKERSGGLLGAMVKDLDYDITHVDEKYIERRAA